MQLKEIDKLTYRKHANIVIGSFIAGLVVFSLAISYTLIAFYGQTAVEGTESTGNFRFNLAGVIAAVLICSAVLYQIRNKPFLTEVYYVWRLKQLTNQIYRKLKRVKAEAENNEPEALACLKFYYAALRQVYLLDDNTLTLSSLDKDIEQLDLKLSLLELELTDRDFSPNWLKNLK